MSKSKMARNAAIDPRSAHALAVARAQGMPTLDGMHTAKASAEDSDSDDASIPEPLIDLVSRFICVVMMIKKFTHTRA
jgi:hypothetical protein